MDATLYEHSLRVRLNQISMILGYLREQRAEVHDNRDWMDPKAYDQRLNLLENLALWYLEEHFQIERELAGLRRPGRDIYDSSSPAAYTHSPENR